MTKDEIRQVIKEVTGLEPAAYTEKEREGRQIKANALWEGSSSPSSARVPLGLFFATKAPELAIEGATQRLGLTVPYPEAVVALFGSEGAQSPAVFGYGDSKVASELAAKLGVELQIVQRPAIATEAKPASSLNVSPLADAIQSIPNVILQGPPGTGKSTLAREYARSLIDDQGEFTLEQCRFSKLDEKYAGDIDAMMSDENSPAVKAPVIWEMIQLHPGYGYDDLVRRIRPASDGGDLKFVVEDRLLPLLCKLAALRGEERPVLLILDEINRCNLSAVLGEFIFAIDKGHRGESVRLQYQGEGLTPSVSVPKNVQIVGTMNTADRSIAMVDFAVRRRFRFLDVPADVDAIDNWYLGDPTLKAIAVEWFELFNENLPNNYKVGHSYFLLDPVPRATWPGRFARQIAFQVLPLLEEYEVEGIGSREPIPWRGIQFALEDSHTFAVSLESGIRANMA